MKVRAAIFWPWQDFQVSARIINMVDIRERMAPQSHALFSFSEKSSVGHMISTTLITKLRNRTYWVQSLTQYNTAFMLSLDISSIYFWNPVWATRYMVMRRQKFTLHTFIVFKNCSYLVEFLPFLITDPRFVYRQSWSVHEEKKTWHHGGSADEGTS